MSAQRVGRRLILPLDQKLALRADDWSSGAARVATRLGLRAKSFDLAAAGFSHAVGRGISGDSMARLTEEWGRRAAEQRNAEAACANQSGRRDESLARRRLNEVAPITTQANISTDGAMMLARGEGWKEVKIVAISEARPRPSAHICLPSPAAETAIRWSNWPITATRRTCGTPTPWRCIQYAERLWQGLDYCPKRSSANDGTL
jgi:hypothetical protein